MHGSSTKANKIIKKINLNNLFKNLLCKEKINKAITAQVAKDTSEKATPLIKSKKLVLRPKTIEKI